MPFSIIFEKRNPIFQEYVRVGAETRYFLIEEQDWQNRHLHSFSGWRAKLAEMRFWGAFWLVVCFA